MSYDPNIKNFSDEQIESQILALTQQEKALTLKILHYLREVERRQIFAKRGFSSLWEYAVKCLGYSESQAQRRISSMRLIREIPEVENKIVEGKLSLATISQVQTFFKQEEKIKGTKRSLNEKLEVLSQLENKSKRDGEKLLLNIFPRVIETKETQKPISPDATELKIVLTSHQQQLLNRLKELKPNLSTSELLEWLLERALEKLDPMQRAKKANLKSSIPGHLQSGASRPSCLTSHSANGSAFQGATSKSPFLQNNRFNVSAFQGTSDGVPLLPSNKGGSSALQRTITNPGNSKPSRYVPAVYKQELWFRSQGRCEFKDQQTNRRCECTQKLEVDHIKPFGLGGKSDLNNLRLVCRAHNSYLAVRCFGSKKMQQHLPSIRG